MILQSHV